MLNGQKYNEDDHRRNPEKVKSGVLPREEVRAGSHVLEQYSRCKKIIGLTASKKADKRVKKIIGDRKVKDLTPSDWKLLEPHLRNYTRYHEAKALLKKTEYQAFAFYFLLENKTEQDALIVLGKKSWRYKNEVTSRLSWMRRQKIEIGLGNKFNHPYLCYVGGLKGRRTVDREHFTLMCFLDQYSLKRKNKFLFDSVPSESIPRLPRPDFIVKDQHGSLLGLEFTEANSTEDSHFHDEKMEWLRKKLKAIFRNEKFILTLYLKPNWREIDKAKKNSIEWVKAEYAKFIARVDKSSEHRAYNKTLNLSFRFTPRNEKYELFDSSEQLNGNQPELLLGRSIRERIRKKLSKKSPSIRPCFLVIHLRNGVPFMKEAIVKREAKKGIGTSFKSHFDQIWAVKESKLMKIL